MTDGSIFRRSGTHVRQGYVQGFNGTLAVHCENIAKEIFDNIDTGRRGDPMKLQAGFP